MRILGTVIVAAALLIPSAYASNVVEVKRPHITFIPIEAAKSVCHKPERRGCTTLQTEFLCSCARNADDKWTLVPHLIATPHMYTTTEDIVRHEMEHVTDIRESLNEYAAGLMLRSFESEQSCSAFVDEEKKTFGNTLHNIQRMTTVKRDGMKYADRAGDY